MSFECQIADAPVSNVLAVAAALANRLAGGETVVAGDVVLRAL